MSRSVSSQVAPFASTRPYARRSRPAATRRMLVFPAPDGPASARHSPLSTASSTSSSRSPRVVRASTLSIGTSLGLPAGEHVPALHELDRQQDGAGYRDQHGRQRQ